MNILAQEKSILITRSIEKQFTVSKRSRLFVNAERGYISIKAWDKNEVKVVLKLLAKNNDQKIARAELDQMNYSLTELRNSVFVSNKLVLSKSGQQIASVIRAKYEIFVPEGIDIHIQNYFGQIKIEGVECGIYGDLNYCDFIADRFNGSINLNISIGDLTCTNSELKGTIVTNHSKISIDETGGQLKLETEYGDLHLAYGNKKLQLGIFSSATEIYVEHPICYPVEMMLTGAYCPLKINKDCYFSQKQFLETNYSKDIEQQKWMLKYLPPDKATRLTIDARFGSVNFL